MSELARLVFDKWAMTDRDLQMEKEHRPVVREALRAIEVKADATILDLGCGNGYVTRALATRLPKATVMGVDISGEMIDRARGGTPADLFNAVFFQGTPLDEALDEERFDLVFGMESIYYMQPVRGTIVRLASIMNPGGQLLLALDYYKENEASHDWPEKYGVEMELHSAEEYCEMLRGAGLVDVTHSRIRLPEEKGRPDYLVSEGSLIVTGQKPAELTPEQIMSGAGV
jgi:trans-aconitate methyltransferase